MVDEKVRIIWNGTGSRVLGKIDTSISYILQVLSDIGGSQDDFNNQIVSAKANPSLPVPCILWCKGHLIGEVIHGLRSKGFCKDL